MFFKRKPVSQVSFYDWVARLSSALDASVQAVQDSTKEDTFENVIRVFRTKTRDTLALITGIEVRVDVKGVYTLNGFTNEKIYLLSFCNGVIIEEHSDESLKKVSARDFIVELLLQKYNHHLAKLNDQEARLIREQKEVMIKKEKLECLIEYFFPLQPSTKKQTIIVDKVEGMLTSEKPSEEPDTYTTE
jgi:hypothetical protein